METVSENRAFGGVQGVYRHASARTGCDMTFAVYLPPQARRGRRVPCLWYPLGPDLHARERDEQGGRAALGGAARAWRWSSPTPRRAARTSPTTASTISARAPASTSTPPRSPGRRISACFLHHQGPADAGDDRVRGRARAPGHHRPFDGRARRADAGDAPPRALPLGLGLRADLPPGGERLGPQAALRLSRRRRGGLGRARRHAC